MADIRISKLAKLLVNYSLRLQKGETVMIQSKISCAPLVREVYKEALIAGAHPIIFNSLEDHAEILFKYGTDEQLSYVPPHSIDLIKTVNAHLTIWGEENTKALTNIDPVKMKLRSQAMTEYSKIHMARIGSGSLKWCGTQFPTNGSAMDAEMSLAEYEDFVYEAGHIDSDDPVDHWIKVHEEQERLVKILNTKSDFEIIAKDTHLKLSTKGRTWENCDGKVNFPDGEVFTSPVEDSMNGHVRYTYPAVYNGREVEDINLTFKDGKVVEAKAAKGEDYLLQMLDIDEGAKLVGEFAIGTNYDIKNFTKNILFDEKIGGTIHIALGAGMPECGSKNESSLHWDMICDMKDGGEIFADGELIYKDGKLLI
ncbi:MAG: aminopeptidase [Lutispora sp.]|nr:aminopeptidase [Lutispora sp.]MDD4835381.1 aminopeptidase [Lutispora sp.]